MMGPILMLIAKGEHSNIRSKALENQQYIRKWPKKFVFKQTLLLQPQTHGLQWVLMDLGP